MTLAVRNNQEAKSIVIGQVSSKSGGKAHNITLGKDGVVYCDCKGWIYSKQTPKTCDHLRRFFAGERS